MKSRPKVLIAAFFAVLVLGAIAADSASAGWFINGSELTAGQTAAVSTTAQVETATILSIPAAKIQIECSGSVLSDEGLELLGGTNQAIGKALVFEGCATTEPATGCTIEKSQIRTLPFRLLVTLASTFPRLRLVYEPQTRRTLATVPFSSANTCAFNEEEPLIGSVTLSAPNGQEEQTEQVIEGQGSLENNSLEVAKDKAFIRGGRGRFRLPRVPLPRWSFP